MQFMFGRQISIAINRVQSQEGFSWSNMLGMVMQLLFNPQQGPNKSDSLDTDQVSSRRPTSLSEDLLLHSTSQLVCSAQGQLS
jgi:hypothetical protein